MKVSRLVAVGIVVLLLFSLTGCVSPETTNLIGEGPTQGLTVGVQLLALLTFLSLLAAVVSMFTSFIRIVIVLSFVRQAIGVPQLPPTPLLLGLALFLTAFVMAPIGQRINEVAINPYLKGEIKQEVALAQGLEPLREFMFKHTREKDLSLFVYMANMERPRNPEEVPTHVLAPAFIISEIKTGFQMGLVILIPFLIIDMVVSSALLSMGMLMLPPVVISLPFKVLLFVLVDGWHLIIKSLLTSFV